MQRSIVAMCQVLLNPIIRILLKAGVNYKYFSTVSRNLFVEIALKEFGIDGRDTNTSRVSILTGISRSEVTKIKKYLQDPKVKITATLDNASRVLTAWHSDPKYLYESGSPMLLPFESVQGPSFVSLLKEYGGDIPAVSLLKELQKTGSILSINKEYKVLKRNYRPSQYDQENIFRIGTVIGDIGNTVHHNLTRDLKTKSRFEKRASNTLVRKKDIMRFHEFLDSEGQEFLERVDAWLTQHEVDEHQENEETVRLGAGLYFIKDD